LPDIAANERSRLRATSWLTAGSIVYDAVARLARFTAVAILTLLTSCSPGLYVDSADRETNSLLREYDRRVLGDRAGSITYPKELPDPSVDVPATTPQPDAAPDADPASGTGASSAAAAAPIEIDLTKSLQLAFDSSRDFKTQTESLYLQGLGFTLTRYNFGPILNSAISYLWNGREDSTSSDGYAFRSGVSQILPTGGTLNVEGLLAGNRNVEGNFFNDDGTTNHNSLVAVSLRQPLLRGAGREVAYEALTQGERNLIYGVRSFELFREDFAIQVANSYYQLQSQKLRLANDEQYYKDSIFDRKKAEALRQVDRYKEEDVFLARRREIAAEDALLVSRTTFQLALDDFRILLGLPPSTAIRIQDEEPTFQQVRLDPASAVEAAQSNRLDVHTQHDQVEDAERQVRLAANNLLADVDLLAGFGYDGNGTGHRGLSPDEAHGTFGLTVELPLNRQAERNSYRASLISLERARRSAEQQLDEVQRDVLNQLRELQQLEKRIELQTEQIERERRAVAITQVRYESGDAITRDVLDARQSLATAQNALIDLKVEHYIGRLRLLRNMGIFFVNENGMWHT